MNIRIDIEYIEFNAEYQADIKPLDKEIKFIASDRIETVMDVIKEIVIEYKKEMTAK